MEKDRCRKQNQCGWGRERVLYVHVNLMYSSVGFQPSPDICKSRVLFYNWGTMPVSVFDSAKTYACTHTHAQTHTHRHTHTMSIIY